EEILRRTEEAQRAVQDLVGVKGGRLVIGAIPSVSAGLLPKAVGIFRRNHPGVDLVLAEGTSEAVADWVEAGKVAFGLVQLPADSHRFDAEVILSEAFVVLVSHEH